MFSDLLDRMGLDLHLPSLPRNQDSSRGTYFAWRTETRLKEGIMYHPRHQFGGFGRPEFCDKVLGQSNLNPLENFPFTSCDELTVPPRAHGAPENRRP